MSFVSIVLGLFGSALSALFSFLPVVTLDALYQFNLGGVDVSTIFGYLNWLVPVADLGIIATAFFAFVTAYNIFLIYTSVMKVK